MTITASAAVPAAPSLAPVEISARGNLFIRRGPDLAFDPIAVLFKGEIARATGRDVLGNWLRIPLPGDASRSGWISIMTEFSEVDGKVSLLPEIEPADWPQLAFLRNCTFHQMMLEPGSLVIPALQSFPANDVRVNPGSYDVLDLDVDGYPEVLSVDVKEGSAIDIIIDGNGEKKKCPVL